MALFYGIDMCSKRELAAANHTIEQIREHVGATSLGYLSIKGAVSAVGRSEDHFCLACFSGEYPLPVPDDIEKNPFETPADVGALSAINAGQPSLIK